jgi:hypothetical protein
MRQSLEVQYTAAACRFPLILQFLLRRKSYECSLYSSLLCVSFVYNQTTDYATSIGNDCTALILILFYVPKFNWVTAKFINPQEWFTWQPWGTMVEWMVNRKVKCTKFSFAILTNICIFFILFDPTLNSNASTKWFATIFRIHLWHWHEDSEDLNEMSM